MPSTRLRARILCQVVVLTFWTAIDPHRAEAASLDQFFIYLWHTPDVADAEAKAAALADAGFTVVDWDPAQLDVLERHSLKAMIRVPFAPDLARKLATDKRVWGYHLGDEPYPEEKFGPLAEQFRAVEREAPHQVPFLNMLSTPGDFLRNYLETVRPTLLSFDYYQWWWGTDRYFEKLEQFRDAAMLAAIPLATCIEGTANPAVERGDKSYLPDNPRKLRQSVYTTLAYGAKGIEWFSADMVFEPKSTTLTPSGRDVAALNRELKLLGPVLFPLRSIDVFHTAPLPAATRTPPKDYWLHVLGEEGHAGLVQGMFKDSQGRDYVLVANRDYLDAQAVNVQLQSKWLGIAPWNKPKVFSYAIEQFDRETQRWLQITSSSSVGFNFILGAGDGQLFRISTQISG
jgi:hypothetical protein